MEGKVYECVNFVYFRMMEDSVVVKMFDDFVLLWLLLVCGGKVLSVGED